MYYRRMLLMVAVLFFATTSVALAWWSGSLGYGWKNQSGFAVFEKKSSPCAIERISLWAANQSLFDVRNYNPPNKDYAWLNISIEKIDSCTGNKGELHLWADLTQKPANKNDTYDPETFAKDGKLRVSVMMMGSDGHPHQVNTKVSFKAMDVPAVYSDSDSEEAWTYTNIFTRSQAFVTFLTVDNSMVVLKKEYSDPSQTYNEDNTYVAR